MHPTFAPDSDEKSSDKAFIDLYTDCFRPLFNYTFGKVNDRFVTQEIVQDAFISLWKQRSSTSIQSGRAYLFAAAKNLIISHYRKEYARDYYYTRFKTESEPFAQ